MTASAIGFTTDGFDKIASRSNGVVTESIAPEIGQLSTSLALIGFLGLLGYRRSRLKKLLTTAEAHSNQKKAGP
jgi:hypothetical protein